MKKIRFVFLILPVILVALLTILVFKPVFSEPKINIYDSAQEFGSQAKARTAGKHPDNTGLFLQYG